MFHFCYNQYYYKKQKKSWTKSYKYYKKNTYFSRSLHDIWNNNLIFN
jgi:hypothetical protein